MAKSSRIRRKRKRRAPAVRRNASAAAQIQQKGEPGEGSVMIGGAHDPAEKAADQMAARALGPGTGGATGGGAPSGGTATTVARKPKSTPQVASGSGPAAAPVRVAGDIASMGSGRALSGSERGYFQPRFGRDFSQVRVHDGPAADRAARGMDARAFTSGNDIAFANGAQSPQVMAHELAHVARGDGMVRRDLALEVPNPGAEPVALTEDQRTAALEYNLRRFEDPFTVTMVRDVIGINRYPGVMDEETMNALLRWQATHGLSQDGKCGPDTTTSIVEELEAEGGSRLARLLREDNRIDVRDITPKTFTPMTSPMGPMNERFRWDVGFRTTMRGGGHLVQRITNEWNETRNPGIPNTMTPTANYWETWRITNNGTVSPRLGNGTNDIWSRVLRRGTSGTWRMTARLYTVIDRPGTFFAKGTAGHARDSADLLSTTALTSRQQDSLGHEEGSNRQEVNEARRTIGGEWNGRGAPATWFNRRL